MDCPSSDDLRQITKLGNLPDIPVPGAFTTVEHGTDLNGRRLYTCHCACPIFGRIAVARSVDNDDDARWLAQRLHRSFGSSVDMNPRFLGWLLLVIGARPVELSIAQHHTALGEN